jgi:hypothetical protein
MAIALGAGAVDMNKAKQNTSLPPLYFIGAPKLLRHGQRSALKRKPS